MEKVNGGKNMPAKRSQRKGFGTNSLQISEYDASALVGGIVEKGFSEGPKQIPLAPPPAPRPTVLPFPVARHRSHGPHWAPKSENRGGGGEDEDEEEEEDLMGFGPLAAAFANPVQRKEKKGLDFSQLKELMTSDISSLTQKKKEDRSLVVKKANEVTEKLDKRISPIGTAIHVLPQKMPPDDTSQAQDVFMEEMDSGLVDEVSQDVIVETREETMEEMEPGLPEVSKRQRQVDTGKQNMSSKRITSSYTPSNMGNEQDFRGIDAENHARLERMSADEIAEAQAEILEKMSPAVIEALRKRGQNKLKKQTGSVSDMAAKGEVDFQDGEKVIKEPKGSLSESGTSHTLTTAASTVTRQGQGYNGLQKLSTNNCNLWDSWSERVEAVRELRFSLDGNVVETDFVQLTKAGKTSSCTIIPLYIAVYCCKPDNYF